MIEKQTPAESENQSRLSSDYKLNKAEKDGVMLAELPHSCRIPRDPPAAYQETDLKHLQSTKVEKTSQLATKGTAP